MWFLEEKKMDLPWCAKVESCVGGRWSPPTGHAYSTTLAMLPRAGKCIRSADLQIGGEGEVAGGGVTWVGSKTFGVRGEGNGWGYCGGARDVCAGLVLGLLKGTLPPEYGFPL